MESRVAFTFCSKWNRANGAALGWHGVCVCACVRVCVCACVFIFRSCYFKNHSAFASQQPQTALRKKIFLESQSPAHTLLQTDGKAGDRARDVFLSSHVTQFSPDMSDHLLGSAGRKYDRKKKREKKRIHSPHVESFIKLSARASRMVSCFRFSSSFGQKKAGIGPRVGDGQIRQLSDLKSSSISREN